MKHRFTYTQAELQEAAEALAGNVHHGTKWAELSEGEKSLVKARGWAIAGLRPDSVFHNQVTRHPAVRSSTQRGVIYLDPAFCRRHELAEAEQS